MKNKGLKPIHLLVAVIFGIGILITLTYVVDYFFNGMVLDWFGRNFLTMDGSVDISNIRMFLTTSLIVAFIVMALAVYFVSGYFIKRKTESTREMINTFMNSDIEAEKVFPKGFELIASDMGKLKAEMQLKERMLIDETKRKNDLITYLAHDLKTPLTSVIGYLTLVNEAFDMPEEQRIKYLKIALDKAYRLEELTNEFFEITRYNLSKINLEKEFVNISYMLVQIADEFYPILDNNKNIELNIEDGLMANIDPNKMARVFNNVIKNAVSYSSDNSNIKVTANRVDNSIKVVVENQGITISKEKLLRIFDKFYRADEARSSNSGGAGLGLAIAKEIVNIHGGTIEAKSHRGITKFTITFPID